MFFLNKMLAYMNNIKIALTTFATMAILTFSISSSAVNLPVGGFTASKTVYSSWKRSPNGFATHRCNRTIYYKTGKIKPDSKLVGFWNPC